jgi:hypothetical protein
MRGRTIVSTSIAFVLAIAAAHTASAQLMAAFHLSPNPQTLACFQSTASATHTANVIVAEGALTDDLTISGRGYKPGLAFELFTVQRSFLTAIGSIDPEFTTFELAWYQTELQANSNGQIFGTLHSTLINIPRHPGVNVRDQIFGFDPDIKLPPTNTFHVGIWFNDPTDASLCGFTGFTPFNGYNHAGPLAMISTPRLDYWSRPAML